MVLLILIFPYPWCDTKITKPCVSIPSRQLPYLYLVFFYMLPIRPPKLIRLWNQDWRPRPSQSWPSVTHVSHFLHNHTWSVAWSTKNHEHDLDHDHDMIMINLSHPILVRIFFSYVYSFSRLCMHYNCDYVHELVISSSFILSLLHECAFTFNILSNLFT